MSRSHADASRRHQPSSNAVRCVERFGKRALPPRYLRRRRRHAAAVVVRHVRAGHADSARHNTPQQRRRRHAIAADAPSALRRIFDTLPQHELINEGKKITPRDEDAPSQPPPRRNTPPPIDAEASSPIRYAT